MFLMRSCVFVSLARAAATFSVVELMIWADRTFDISVSDITVSRFVIFDFVSANLSLRTLSACSISSLPRSVKSAASSRSLICVLRLLIRWKVLAIEFLRFSFRYTSIRYLYRFLSIGRPEKSFGEYLVMNFLSSAKTSSSKSLLFFLSVRVAPRWSELENNISSSSRDLNPRTLPVTSLPRVCMSRSSAGECLELRASYSNSALAAWEIAVMIILSLRSFSASALASSFSRFRSSREWSLISSSLLATVVALSWIWASVFSMELLIDSISIVIS
mmetsp:Transcript_14686/g.16968  ORF Transcript_14686/g.16968 Transcript_14686/m.16968 type:complete len:275 (-) Transcript_14686:4002-4826(-)